MFAEHGEERIIQSFFKGKRDGLVLEAGARDGIIDSNSRDLILNYNWSAVLVEPDPRQFQILQNNYKGIERCNLLREVLHHKNEVVRFYLAEDSWNHSRAGHGTMSESFKHRAQSLSGVSYSSYLDYQTKTLKQLLSSLGIQKIDYMSIDCEGNDLNVINGIDFTECEVSLISVEPSSGLDRVSSFMETKGYKFYDRTNGNAFYAKS